MHRSIPCMLLLLLVPLTRASTAHAEPERRALVELLEDGTWRFVGASPTGNLKPILLLPSGEWIDPGRTPRAEAGQPPPNDWQTCPHQSPPGFICGAKVAGEERLLVPIDETQIVLFGRQQLDDFLTPPSQTKTQRPPPPKSKASKPSVTGGLTVERVQRITHRHRNEYRYCYERQLNKQRALAGRIGLRITVARNGAVSNVKVTNSTMNSEPVERCLIRKVRRWVFPAPKDGGSAVVDQAFEFSPKS